jgi:UDP-N-acetylmuramate: L-alanyl-gamma-D-glutamyl-meso-diaminopimelate ligase
VIEGDEYLTSALDPRPKFLHYKPQIALISGVAWDHINVFPTWEGYKKQFELLIDEIEKSGSLVYCADDDVLSGIVDASCEKDGCPQHVLSYNLPEFLVENGITILVKENGDRIPLSIFGKHNLLNLEGARLVCQRLGIGGDTFMEAIRSFKGSARRLELIDSGENSAMFKDFAHAPSKLKATVEAVKQQYPQRKLIAVMELHTYSSLSRNFLSHYKGSLDSADVPVVFFSKHALALKKLPEITVEEVKAGFDNKKLEVFTDPDQLKDFLLGCDYNNSNLLMMSSGNFGGIDLEELRKTIFS